MAWPRPRYSKREKKTKWTALYRDANGKERSAGTYETKERAQEVADAMEAGWDPRADDLSPKEKATITLAEYAPIFLRRKDDIEPNTRMTYRAVQRKYVERNPIGQLRMAEVTPVQLQRFLRQVKNDVSPTTARQVRTVLSGMFEMARVIDGIRDDNPIVKLKVGTPDREPVYVFLPEQFETFVTFLPNRPTRVLAYFLFSTGMRPSEAAALRTGDINFASRSVMINKAVKKAPLDMSDSGVGLVVSNRTKNNKWRSFPINEKCLKMVQDYIDAYGIREGEVLFPAALITGYKDPYIVRQYSDEELEALGVIEYKGRIFRHGDVATYHHYKIKCRCNACQSAHYFYLVERRSTNRMKLHRQENCPYFNPVTWGRIFGKAMIEMMEAGLAKHRVDAYKLRHSHAWHMHTRGMTAQAISKRLGNTVEVLEQSYFGLYGEHYGSIEDREVIDNAVLDYVV